MQIVHDSFSHHNVFIDYDRYCCNECGESFEDYMQLSTVGECYLCWAKRTDHGFDAKCEGDKKFDGKI